MSNAFKIINSTEEVPTSLRKDVMKSAESAVLALRFVQLFIGDYTATALENLKINTSENNSDHETD